MTNQQGTLVISLDFELLWGVLDIQNDETRKKILRTREVNGKLLTLFEHYQIHATWATVGFLFFDTPHDLMSGLPTKLPSYANSAFSPYSYLESISADCKEDLLHFAPSLIKDLACVPFQELGTHTFSHYYCLEDGQTPEEFEADLQAALAVAKRSGYEIESIVFPRNQYSSAYLQVCAQNGIITYRGNEHLWFRRGQKRRVYRQAHRRMMRLLDAYINLSGYHTFPLPQKSGELPINLPSSRYLRPYAKKLRRLEPLRLKRVLNAMRHAAQQGEVFHLWLHPEDFCVAVDENINFFAAILAEFARLQTEYGMQSKNMSELAHQILAS